MDEETLQQQEESILSGSPVATAVQKPRIIRERVSLEPETPGVPYTQTIQQVNPDEGKLVNTTKTSKGTTIHVNDGSPDMAKLVSSGGDAYIGGSVSPNSSVRAKLRVSPQHVADPFWLETTDRFTPVGPWTAEMSILKNPVKLNTTDPDKGSMIVAHDYFGVPEENFFGYEYMPAEDYTESWWSAFLRGGTRGAASLVAHLPSAVKGLWSEEEAGKTLAQVEAENRESWWLVRNAQKYLDLLNQLEPVPQSRGGEIAEQVGAGVTSYGPVVAGVLTGGAGGVAAGRLMSGIMAMQDTIYLRDEALGMGMTARDAQKKARQLGGAILGLEAVGGTAGHMVSQGLIKAALNRGASRALTRVAGLTGQGISTYGIDPVVETYQNKVAPVILGKEGWRSLLGFTREDWNTVYATMILGSLAVPAGAREGVKSYDDFKRVDNGYLELVLAGKKTLIDSAKANGMELSPEFLKKFDQLAVDIYNNPEAMVDEDMRSVAQGLADRFQNLSPEALQQAQALIDKGKGEAFTQERMKAFDARVDQEMLSGLTELTEQDRAAIHGMMRGAAYINAAFFGKSPDELVLPKLANKRFSKRTLGVFNGGENTIRIPIKGRAALDAVTATSPFDKYTVEGYQNAEKQGHFISTLVHELSHANDWGLGTKGPDDLSGFVEWYIGAIERAFGKENAQRVGEAIRTGGDEDFPRALFGTKGTHYTSPKNATEWRAQAIARLRADADEYIGLAGFPAETVTAVNAILNGMNGQSFVSQAMTDYFSALKAYAQLNSARINTIGKAVNAETMRRAIEAYMGGEDIVDWNGVTQKTLSDFAQALDAPLDADTLRYATEALGDVPAGDFIAKQRQEFREAFGPAQATTTEQVASVRKNAIDGDLDPERVQDLEDWEYNDEIARDAVVETVPDKADFEDKSRFAKKLERKFNGHTLEEDMDFVDNALDEHEYKKTGTMLDFMRGIPSFLTAIGGKKLADQFGLVGRYEDFVNKKQELDTKLTLRVLPLFGGSLWKYEDYVRKTAVPMYTIKYRNPASGEIEQRTFSKRELVSGVLYDEQPDSHDRIAKTVDMDEVRSHLDKRDIDFAHELRQFLYDEHTRIKGGKNVPVNYWPIMDAYAQEKGQENIINDFGRINTDEPIGLVDVMQVAGSYNSRVAGSQSGYFAGVRRLDTILNYDSRANYGDIDTIEESRKNEDLDKKSALLRRRVMDRIGPYNMYRLKGRIDDIVQHKNDVEVRNGLLDKMARNSIGTLLYGNVKQVGVASGNSFLYLGYKHNTLAGYMTGLLKAVAMPWRTLQLAKENDTLFSRYKDFRASEYMHKNLSSNDDNLLTYAANWATRKDWSSVEAVTDYMIHLAQGLKRLLSMPVVGADFIFNAIGYAASYDAALKGEGSPEAARRSLAEFLTERQSTANQAVKGLMVRQANRQPAWGNLFQFTGEGTQKWGQIGQDINRMRSGDMPITEGVRDITGMALSMAAYVAVQAGIVQAGLTTIAGVGPSDKEWDEIYDNVYREIIGQLFSAAGPFANIAQQSLLPVFTGERINMSASPLLGILNTEIQHAQKGEYDKAMLSLMSLMGVGVGLPKLATTVQGGEELTTAKTKKQVRKATWMLEGRSEGYAKHMAGIKNKSKKKTPRKRKTVAKKK